MQALAIPAQGRSYRALMYVGGVAGTVFDNARSWFPSGWANCGLTRASCILPAWGLRRGRWTDDAEKQEQVPPRLIEARGT